MRRIELRAAAEDDIAEIGIYLQQSSSAVAERFVAAVIQSIDRLAANPGMGAPWRGARRYSKDLRAFTVTGFPKYLIFYRFDDRTLFVIRVLHGARDLTRILRSD